MHLEFVLQDEKVLGLCCTTTGIYIKLGNCTLKDGEDGTFYVICKIAIQNKKD